MKRAAPIRPIGWEIDMDRMNTLLRQLGRESLKGNVRRGVALLFGFAATIAVGAGVIRPWGLGGGNAPRKMPRSRDDAFRAWQRNIQTPTTRARDQTKGAHGFAARASDGMGRDGRF